MILKFEFKSSFCLELTIDVDSHLDVGKNYFIV